MKSFSLFLIGLMISSYGSCQDGLVSISRISSSNDQEGKVQLAIDGDLASFWQANEGSKEKWLFVVLSKLTEIEQLKIYMEDDLQKAIPSFAVQTYINGRWDVRFEMTDNENKEIKVEFEEPVLNDRLRLVLASPKSVKVREMEVYGKGYEAKDATPVKRILVNQSGYNLNKPKRFTAPHTPDNFPFSIVNTRTQKAEFKGTVQNHIGDFTDFNPENQDEYLVKVDTSTSFPFRIAPYWLERVTYQNMVDFMTGARHYVGTTNKIRRLSWAWRDGDFFNWALQCLIAQYLSNPEAYKRLERKINYINNSSFPAEYKGKWGTLDSYDESAPDIVKLIHWDVDVKISQHLEHEHQKAELAHFLYAFPYLKEWLPQQNFDVVYDYVKSKWTKAEVAKSSTTQYDKSPEHNLLSLKTQLGTFKGELPPGHSIIPNLMMYEVAKLQGETNADHYFKAAYNQMEWMITNLDWEDPLTTKGQRMSEHITMRAFAYFYHQYPENRPAGLYAKIKDWAEVAIRRSNNLWDFRKFTDEGDWIPAGWNETGNVLGFPAAALAAKSVIKEIELQTELDRIAWSHFDNVFGRNPTGRHFSYDGPKEIEGVDQGWYNTHHGGVGLLEPVPFVFDGSPKTNHYPNHPEIGNFGWTEGWVQFNTAFNTSMAYLANSETNIEIVKKNNRSLQVRLKAPLNFDENKEDAVTLKLQHSNGNSINLLLKEEGRYSPYLSTTVQLKKRKVKYGKQQIRINRGDTLWTSYGLGYFEHKASWVID